MRLPCISGQEFFPKSFYTKTEDFEGHFTTTHLPFSLTGKPKDLRKVTNSKILTLFLRYYRGEKISEVISYQELIELHKLADYLFEGHNPINPLWKLTLQILHKLDVASFREAFLSALLSIILNSFEKPSIELIVRLTQELHRASEKEQEAFFKTLKGDHPIVHYLQGYCYAKGIGVLMALEKARDYYNKSAHEGYTPAQYSLGVFYERGLGGTKDMEKAWEFYTKAAYLGVRAYKPALAKIADFYRTGTFVEKNTEKASCIQSALIALNYAPLLHDKAAAEQNYPPALYNLATGYQIRNLDKSLKYFERAFKANWTPSSMEEYSIFSAHAVGIEIGLKLLERAVKKGYPYAQYEWACHPPANPPKGLEAKKLLIQAAKQHHKRAISLLMHDVNPIDLSKEDDNFFFFRKKYNELVDRLKDPHILQFNKDNSIKISPLYFQGELLPSPECELIEKERLRQTITQYICMHAKSAAFLTNKEKAKLRKLPLFSEGVPQIIQEILANTPTFAFSPHRLRDDMEWKGILHQIKAEPRCIKVTIESEGLDIETIYIPKPLLPLSFQDSETGEGPINLGKTKKKILGVFLDYLYGTPLSTELTRAELMELKTLADQFKAKDLIKEIASILAFFLQQIKQFPSEKITNILSKIKRNPQELIYLRTHDKVFAAHSALLPKYFHAATSFKKTAMQALILDLRNEVSKDTLETFLLLEYGLLEVSPCNWEKTLELFNFCYFTGRTLH